MSTARRNDLALLGVAAALLVVDQLTKLWIRQYFTTGAPKPPIPVLGQMLQIEFDANTGVAFSLLTGNAALLVFIALALVVIGTLYWRWRDSGSLLLKVTFGLILGGAIGNIIDRFSRGYVTDFIHFQVPHVFDFAVFNVADSGISIGVLLLAYLVWRGDATANANPANPAAPSADMAAASSSASAPRVRRPISSRQP